MLGKAMRDAEPDAPDDVRPITRTREGYASTRRVTDGEIHISALPGVSIDLTPLFTDG